MDRFSWRSWEGEASNFLLFDLRPGRRPHKRLFCIDGPTFPPWEGFVDPSLLGSPLLVLQSRGQCVRSSTEGSVRSLRASSMCWLIGRKQKKCECVKTTHHLSTLRSHPDWSRTKPEGLVRTPKQQLQRVRAQQRVASGHEPRTCRSLLDRSPEPDLRPLAPVGATRPIGTRIPVFGVC